MPFFDLFKWDFREILGIPMPRDQPNSSNDFSLDPSDSENYSDKAKYFRKIWDDTHDQNDDYNSEDIFRNDGIDIFNESLEIHRHMERQMNEMMKMFGMNLFGMPSSSFHDNSNEHGYNFDSKPVEGELRDQYLKPGFYKNKSTDSDLDGLIAPNDLDNFMKNDRNPSNSYSPESKDIVPFHNQSNPNFFSRVIVSRTITKPDGTIETRRTVKDSRTNEEETTVTITQKGSDDPYRDITPINPTNESDMWRKFFKF